MTERLVLGTRGSELALAQACMVEEALRGASPQCQIERKIITTSGDETAGPAPVVDLRAGRKGLFTGEIEKALVRGEVDAAVHSAKDLPSQLADGTAIGAVLPRARAEDFLLSLGDYDLESLPRNGIVATGSVRRRHQLRWKRPDLEIVDLRGNVPTRLRKLAREEWHGAILAGAGLERLGVKLGDGQIAAAGMEFFAHRLPPEIFLPAGGQGIIAVQVREDDERVRKLLEQINHEATEICLRAEREFLRLLDGDCNAPVGVHATVADGTMKVQAQVFEVEGNSPREATVEGSADAAEKLAAELWNRVNNKIRGDRPSPQSSPYEGEADEQRP